MTIRCTRTVLGSSRDSAASTARSVSRLAASGSPGEVPRLRGAAPVSRRSFDADDRANNASQESIWTRIRYSSRTNAEESDALFVHGLAVRRSAAGLGVGSALLTFAVDRAAHSGVPWVRLDCNKNNERLQAYYRSEGFAYLRTIDLAHRNTGALFQKPSARSSAVRAADDSGIQFVVDLPARERR